MTIAKKIFILVVEDSDVVRAFLVNLLNEDPAIKVIATAVNGQEAVEMALKHSPDLITMDINMPKLNGFDATEKIMHVAPTPIVIVSSNYDKSNTDMHFNALKAGALAILSTPLGFGHKDHKESVKYFLNMIRLMSEIKVIRKHSSNKHIKSTDEHSSPVVPTSVTKAIKDIQLIAIGASAGGPLVLLEILEGLPDNFHIPIIIVQHVDATFSDGLYNWLLNTTRKNIKQGENGEMLLPGTIYLAPKDRHIGISKDNRIIISNDAAEHNCRPSVSYLFRSVRNTSNKHAIGILLSGMGVDGAMELKELKDMGCVTIAQDRESSLVHGMPGEAIRLNGYKYIMNPTQITLFLNNLKQ